MFWRLGLRVRAGFGRVVPDPFVITVALFVVAIAGSLANGREPSGVVADVRSGLWNLLAFSAQASLMLVLGHAIASARAVRRGLVALTRLPSSPRGLVAWTAFLSIVLSLFNWSLCLVGGALLAREAGRVARERGFSLHYPILCSAGYAGMMVWHGGLSGTAPLKVTSMADLVEVLGPELATRVGPISLEDTLLGAVNLFVTLGLVALGPIVFVLLTPPRGADPSPIEAPREPAPEPPTVPSAESEAAGGPVAALEKSRASTWLLGAVLAAVLVVELMDRGFARIDLNVLNLVLWIVALVLHGGPMRFLAACEDGVRGCAALLLQFPLYAAITGVVVGSGLGAAVTAAFLEVGRTWFLPLLFLSAGALNVFIPSGGGQWAVQGPLVVGAGLDLGVRPEHVVMAVAYGDQWTNMIQPFWALPLLAITGARARDIVGYSSLWMVVGGAWIFGVLALSA